MTKTVLLPLLSLIRYVNSDFEEGHSLMIKVSPFFTKSKSFKAAAAEIEEIPGMVLVIISDRPASVHLTRSIPKDYKQGLKNFLNFKGYKINELYPRRTRTVSYTHLTLPTSSWV